ncbi:MAG: ATP-binding protein [Haliscomenobacter sp.]
MNTTLLPIHSTSRAPQAIRTSHRRWWILLLLLQPLWLWSQSPDLELIRHQWTSRDGLPDWNITCFMQDSKGLMWMVSNSGLFTFDGQSFHPISSVNKRKNPWLITKLAEDVHGNIWLIGIFNNSLRIDVLHPESERIQHIEDYLHLPAPFEPALTKGTILVYNINQKIWIGTLQEAYHYDGRWGKVFSRTTLSDGIWLPGPENTFWLRNEQHLFLSDERGNRLDSFSHPGNILRWVWLDTNRTLWTAFSPPGQHTIGHYYQLIPNRQRITSLLTQSPPQSQWINEQALDGQGKQFIAHGLLLSQLPGGLFLGKGQHATLFNLSQKYPDAETMLAFYFDREEGIWSCSTEGLTRFVLRKKAPFRTWLDNWSPPQSMRGLSRSGGTLYALGYGGAKKIDLPSNQITPLAFKANNLGYAMYQKGDTVWIGTDQQHIHAILPNGKLRTFQMQDAGIQTFSFIQSTSLGFLAGTNQGIYRLNQRNGRFERTEAHNFEVYSMYENRTGLWACTSNGVLLLDSALNIRRRGLLPGSKSNYQRPQHLCEDGENQFWVATRGGGLLHWNYQTGAVRQFNTDHGLSSNNVHAVYADNNGFLWLPSDHGLMRFRTRDHLVQTFLKTNGIADDEFNFLSHFQDSDGTLYFGGINGITSFHPHDLPLSAEFNRPLVLIEAKSFQLKQGIFLPQTQHAQPIQTIHFHPSDAFLDLNFSPLIYEDNSSLRFAWKIGGFQEKWVQQSEPLIRISHLPYGKQILQVRFSRLDNQWSKIYTFPIQVIRPFYLTWPFFILILGTLAGLIYGFARWRNRRLQQANLQLEQEVRRRTAEINQHMEIIERDKETILQQSRELRTLDEMKSRFFTNITHELRSPLTLILGPLERLIQHRERPESTPAALDTIRRHALKLLNLVEELLDLSKMEANKLELDLKPLPLLTFCQRLVGQFVPFATQRHIDLQQTISVPDHLTILTDARKLEKIVTNLIHNALKFTPSGGHILVHHQYAHGQLMVQVSDTGPGIPEADLPHIFDRYFQSKSVHSSLQGGAGIGLALAREYTRLLGGTLDVRSAPDQGSTFTLHVPCTQTPTHTTLHTQPLPTPPIIPAPIPGLPLLQPSTPTILLVEDDPEMADYIQSVLKNDYQVRIAYNGQSALNLLESETADLIVSDIMMPEMDGFQFLAEVKKIKFDLPFIFLTARIESPDRLHALRLGVDDYLTKPFLEEELLVRLRNLIQRYHIRRALRLEISESPKISAHQESTPPETETYDEKWLRKLEQLVEQNLRHPDFSVRRIADALHITERTLQYKTKMHTGLTPNQYLVEARLQKARQLLESRQYSTVSEVCFAVGFKTTQYFARLMKERFGKTPSEW